MDRTLPALPPHREGEQLPVEEFSATVETFAGRVHLEWDSGELVSKPTASAAVKVGR
jgi:hypothetical protein